MWRAEKFSWILNEQEGHLMSLLQPLCHRSRQWKVFLLLFVCAAQGWHYYSVFACTGTPEWSLWMSRHLMICNSYKMFRGGGAWRVFKVSLHRDWSCSLGHDERLKQTQVADLMDALKRGPQSNKAYHIFWKRDPFFYYVICQRHRKPH